MDGYETDGSSALDPVFNDDSSVDESWRDIGPNLQTIEGGGQGGPASDRGNFSVIDGGKHAERNADARAVGRAAENGASGLKPNAQDAKASENSPFTNSVKGKDEKDKKKRRNGMIRMIGPSGLVIAILGVVVTLVAGSQWLFPFGLVANGLDQFNVLRTSMNRRTNVMLRMQMNTNRNYTTGGIFSKEKFKISNSLQKKFARNGIDYIDDAGGVRILYYEDEDTGERLAVAANEEDVERIPDTVTVRRVTESGEEVLAEVPVTKKLTLAEAIDTNENFNLSQNRATRTLRGHIAGWFDSISDAFHRKISNFRNKFVNTSKTADDEEIRTDARRNTLSTNIGDVDVKDPGTDTGVEKVELDENGEPVLVENDDGEMVEKTYVDGDPMDDDGSLMKSDVDLENDINNPEESTLNGKLNNRSRKILAGAQKAGTAVCMVLRTFGAISMTIAALQVAQILNYVSGFLESVDQTKAGEGGSVLAFYMGPEGWSKMGPTYNSRGQIIEGRENSNSMLAKPTKAFFGGSPVTPDDESVQKISLEYATSNAIGSKADELGSEFLTDLSEGIAGFATNAGKALAAYKACNTLQLVVNGIQLADDISTLANLIGAFFTGGATLVLEIVKDIAKGVVENAQFIAATVALGILIPMIVPHVAQWLAMDLIGNMAGEDAAYVLSSGFNIYAGRQMQQSSGMPGNRAQVAAQFRETQAVIAEEAEYERMTHSPFDITNKNTFLGSLAYSMIPVATTMKFSSLFSTASQLANTVGSSVTSLFPIVRAAGDETWFILSWNDECPTLAVNGLTGDAYCNPYFISDYSTINTDPVDVFRYLCERGAFEEGCNTDFPDTVDSEGNEYPYNPVVEKSSDFAKWIVSCAMRDSQFGYIDDRINTWTIDTGSAALDAIVDTGIGVVPGSSILDIMDSAENLVNIDWSTGAACSSDREDIKMFSRYSEDQRLLESEGLIEESAVTAFMNEYYEKNPIDNSLEGIIARYSGMSMDKVNETLDVIAYADYVFSYKPEERRQFSPAETKQQNDLPLDNDDVIAAEYYILAYDNIVFPDLRNRTILI